MKTRTRTIISFLLLLLGFTPVLVTITFYVKKDAIRVRMKEKLESSVKMETVVIPVDEVVWMDDHEIWVQEQMFDIYSKELKEGKYIFTGHFDKEETKLVVEKRKADKKHHDERKLLTKLFQLIPFTNGVEELENFSTIEQTTKYGSRKNFHLLKQYLKVSTPPPECAHLI